MIVQEHHFDPFGLHLTGIEKEGSYPYQYNGLSEQQADPTGKGYSYETDWRGYDPQLGRFKGIDALADEMPGINPYQYSYNNPVMFNDPSGENPLLGALIGAGAGGVVGGVISVANGGNFWSGAWKGALIGAGVGAGVGALYQSKSALGQFTRNVIDNGILGTDPWYAWKGATSSSIGQSLASGGKLLGQAASGAGSLAGRVGGRLLHQTIKVHVGRTFDGPTHEIYYRKGGHVGVEYENQVYYYYYNQAVKDYDGKWYKCYPANVHVDGVNDYLSVNGDGNHETNPDVPGEDVYFELSLEPKRYKALGETLRQYAAHPNEVPRYGIIGRRCTSMAYYFLKKSGINLGMRTPISRLINSSC
jgi:RHS repeat-associated protein